MNTTTQDRKDLTTGLHDMKHVELRQGDFVVSTDPSRFDITLIHQFLSRSYWSEGIPREIVERSIENSLCFGVFEKSEQVGFARVITDRATFAYLADVFILESHRGRGLGKLLMECISKHPQLQQLRDGCSRPETPMTCTRNSGSSHWRARNALWNCTSRMFTKRHDPCSIR